jgi:mannose-1-phosphate guanylyltransferase
MRETMSVYERKFGVKITFSVESEPLGTAGPLALASSILLQSSEPFFVLNSDIICDFPFQEMMKAHKASKAMGTLLVTKVSEPSKYG